MVLTGLVEVHGIEQQAARAADGAGWRGFHTETLTESIQDLEGLGLPTALIQRHRAVPPGRNNRRPLQASRSNR